jgi:cysteine desulfurase family protein
LSATRLYFDNSATSHPKPPVVAAAVLEYFEAVHASAGRGAYREAVAAVRLLAECRAAIATLLNCRPDDHVIFTLNGTDALNLAIRALVRPGDHVVTTVMDHNSVLRPLSALEMQTGVQWTAVAADPETTLVEPGAIQSAIQANTRLVVVCHASNVTGVVQPIGAIAASCRAQGVPLLVDAAQSAGHVPIDFAALGIDLLAMPGHKGLLGPLGTGVLVIRGGMERQMRTVREGGTGSASELPVQPDALPDRFEAGSHNAPGIAGLLAAVRWLLERGVGVLREHECALCRRMRERLDAIRRLRWFGPRDVEQRVGVFSVRIDGIDPEQVSAILESQFSVLSRSGLHCAPLAHRTIGTLDAGGTTRLSFGPFTTLGDIDLAADALARIAEG